jgi:hypothetical protein
MKNEKGVSLVELLIFVVIVATIISISTACQDEPYGMAGNEAAAIEGCRTIALAQVAYAVVNNNRFTDLTTLVKENYLDARFLGPIGFNGYTYASGDVNGTTLDGAPPTSFGFLATPTTGSGRHTYGIGPDQVVRYQGTVSGAAAPSGLAVGDPIEKN